MQYRTVVAALAGCLTLTLTATLMAAQWTPDPSIPSPSLHQRLYEIARHYCDTNFDPDANLVGSSTHHPPNKKHHSTRESAYYAYGLLLTGDPADRARAQAILHNVVATQDTNPQSPTYGAFGWQTEDKPGDLNSAAFVGLTLADVIDLDHRHQVLDPDLRAQVEQSCRLAILEIMHRDVDPGYTNIAFLSTALAAAGEKFWHVPGAASFAQTKIDNIMKLADDGAFAEYLSPTYTGVSMYGAYMCRKFAFSDAFSAKADDAIKHLWKEVSLAYHAPTDQLGGPYLRAYGDNMLDYAAVLKYFIYLGLDGNYPLPDKETDHDWDKACLFAVADLPIGPQPDFKQTPPPWRAWTAVASSTAPVRRLFQYRDGNFILGTVAFQDEWKQKRNLVAFWRNDDSSPEGFRVGFCIDQTNENLPPGYPGEKLHFYSQQEKGSALVAIVASSDIPGHGGNLTLVFDKAAKMEGKGDAVPVRIADGSITTYIYPVATKPVTFDSTTNARTMLLTRSWESADAVGDLHILAYVIAFRPSNQPPPDVSGLSLTVSPDKSGDAASAKVDGADLSLSFKN